jgi:photosystem II stability/assembly factor-like uncharacterized protein
MNKSSRQQGRGLIEAIAVLAGVLIGTGVWYGHADHAANQAMPAGSPTAAAATEDGNAEIPAAQVAAAARAPLFAAARAGTRIVAVGEHGVILLSDDEGKTFRQARSVPTQALLTSLSFVDDHQGWAAGHDGVVLHTTDSGETWSIQRQQLDGDKPLFSIYFRDAQHGIAVGLFGSAVQTADGGNTWAPLTAESGDENDHHLYWIFGDPATALCIAAEAGLIYRSTDGGATWMAIQTSNPGSFWTGARLQDGSFIAAGQRGHVLLSHDQGASWNEVPSGTDQSLTGVIQLQDGSLRLIGLAGTTLASSDGGKTFTAHTRDDRVPLYAILAGAGNTVLLFGEKGLAAGD